MATQHTTPCRECPFRRVAPQGYFGGNEPRHFAVLANHDGHFPCHRTMGKRTEAQCAGRAIMWANQAKQSRDTSVPQLAQDKNLVFANIGEFVKHHHINITPMQLAGFEPLDHDDDEYEEDDEY